LAYTTGTSSTSSSSTFGTCDVVIKYGGARFGLPKTECSTYAFRVFDDVASTNSFYRNSKIPIAVNKTNKQNNANNTHNQNDSTFVQDTGTWYTNIYQYIYIHIYTLYIFHSYITMVREIEKEHLLLIMLASCISIAPVKMHESYPKLDQLDLVDTLFYCCDHRSFKFISHLLTFTFIFFQYFSKNSG
jgi:hypothetical protein